MPNYDYVCPACGPFTAMRPMAVFLAPYECPDCGAEARRVILTAPGIANMDAGRRSAHATNERSSNAPKLASKGHGAGCGCCGPKPKGLIPAAANAAKGFPGKRPWMISH